MSQTWAQKKARCTPEQWAAYREDQKLKCRARRARKKTGATVASMPPPVWSAYLESRMTPEQITKFREAKAA